eukprot:TRINITY_DN5794_c1_g3_i2.p2 TRINITY_DN5794_c1_g3~~TRINITY_DN5794_c1_g3_i2.p2  ORF type:complete len:104 (-),score=26.23 TRINITY_DN5794_c1_g3_i2:127-438(-)
MSRVTIRELLWGSDLPDQETFDVILGADLTYDFDDLPILISTLRNVSHATSRVYIAYGVERAATETFLEMAREHFEVTSVPDSSIRQNENTYTINVAMMQKKS